MFPLSISMETKHTFIYVMKWICGNKKACKVLIYSVTTPTQGILFTFKIYHFVTLWRIVEYVIFNVLTCDVFNGGF